MSERQRTEVEFEGEEPGSGYASPFLDLVSTAVLGLISIGFMVASSRLPVPGDLTTAPGLLPFMVSGTLFLMALGLGISAVTRWRSGSPFLAELEGDRATFLRSLLLCVAVASYISALQLFAFQYRFEALGLGYRLSAFEPVTLIALSVIIHAFWHGPIWISVCISAVWAVTLSLVFQKVFNIPLPGSF